MTDSSEGGSREVATQTMEVHDEECTCRYRNFGQSNRSRATQTAMSYVQCLQTESAEEEWEVISDEEEGEEGVEIKTEKEGLASEMCESNASGEEMESVDSDSDSQSESESESDSDSETGSSDGTPVQDENEVEED
jgi:hypothetical protein